MKPFNIKEYNDNPSKKVITRDGRPVRILCTNARRSYPVVALIEDNDNEEDLLYAYLPDGTMCGMRGENDLFFAPEKKEGYVNLFKQISGINTGFVFNTKEEAEKSAKGIPCYITTAKIEWEE